jgi:Zn-dependent protease
MLMHFLRGPLDGEAWAGLLSWLIAVTVAITVHEFAHAKSAELAGDGTPRRFGRVTLNPVAHYDLIGSTMFLLFGFGWAKPVPINPLAFRHPRRDTVLVSLWGPLSNFITAVIAAVPLRLGVLQLDQPYGRLVMIIVFANLMLGVFNLIPVGPLDGAHVLEGLLSARANQRLAAFYAQNQRWLLLLVLAIVFIPAVGNVIFGPILRFVELVMALLVGRGGL